MGLLAVTRTMEKAVLPAKRLLEVTACAVLALMMFITAADVALRYLFNSPIPGALEVVEYMMAVMVPFALTVTAFHKAHIAVDLVMERFSVKVRAHVACLTNFVAFILYAAITWRTYLNISEQFHSGLTSAVLLIPQYPFVISLTAAFALLSMITLVHFFETLTKAKSQWTRS